MARPREFDREVVLDRAMQTFWRYGYEGTSIQDLVKAMGINRGSLYDTFGDKHALFLEAIAHYEETIVNQAISCLEAPSASRQTIIHFFYDLVDLVITDRERRGCLMTNTAIELCPHDEAAATRIARNFQRLEKAFTTALTRAKDKGELSSKHDLKALASYLCCTLQGLRVLSKVNPDRQLLKQITEVAISVLESA